VLRLVLVLLPWIAVGCTLVEDLDGYAGGPRDSGSADTQVPALDTAAFDTAVADTSVVDSAETPDTSVTVDTKPDTQPTDVATDVTVDTAPPPYRHTVTIDGTNDFNATAEKLTTTTAGFDTYVSWDDNALYFGYVGSDLGAGATANKWVLVYVDVDPGTANGATKTEAYGTQQHTLPSGFAADVYFALKTDESFQQLKKYSAGTWTTVATSGVTFKRTASSNFVEIRIPFSALTATPSRLGVLGFMLNEETTGPWTWAGTWNGSFIDGNSPIATPKAIGNWLQVDLSSAASPSAAANKKP